MAKPNLRQLEVFSVMMETGSVSETARRLHVTQPAVSKTIANLEEIVGLQLFRRVRGRIIPSTDAERLNAEVDRVFAQMDSLVGSIIGLRSARAGHLTLATVPAMAATVVGLCAGKFLEDRPRVRLTLMARMSPQAVEDVSRHRVELGFIHGPPADPDVEGIIVGESEFVCAMRRSHPLAAMQTLTPQDLRQQSLIFLDAASPPSQLVRDKFAQANVVPKVVMETNMSFAARAAVLNSNSVAVIDSLFAMTDERPDLVVRPFRPRVPLQIYCIYSAHRPLSPLAQQFIADVRERIAADRTEASLIAWS
jgi:DNA-binding transcriptional LysR family regulator